MGSEGLTNDDFRKLLATPRRTIAGESRNNASKNQKDKNIGNKNHKNGDGRNIQRNIDEKAAGKKPEEPSSSAYRDRAEERRRGSQLDKGDEVTGQGHSIIPQKDITSLSLEESKYLGGDEEHTHLVKGLDYALLSKVRAEREQKKRLEEEQRRNALEQEKDGKRDQLNFKREPQQTAENTAAGLALRAALKEISQQSQNQINDVFLSKKTVFVYALRTDDKFEMPTMRMRAKDISRGDHESARFTNLRSEILDVISNAVDNESRSQGPDITGRASRGTEQPKVEDEQVLPVDEDEDIFEDAGKDYIPEKTIDRDTTNNKTKKAYFEEKESEAVEGKPDKGAGATLSALNRADTARVNQIVQQDKARVQEKRKKFLQQQEDEEYAECYPSYFNAAGAVEDSDDEGAVAEEGASKGKITKETKEGLKIDHELNRIQKIFEDKGYEHSQAFGAGKKPVERTGDESEGAAAVMKKKRRI